MGLRIVVTGKGGSGKTTIAALTSITFSLNGYRVLALDTDSVPNLALSLGIPQDKASKIVPLVKNEELIAERTGAKPGEGWGILFSLTPDVSDITDRFGVKVNENLTLVVVGSIDVSKEGCLCPAIALAKAFLLHILLRPKDVVVIDSEAGAEVFGRGLAERFDVNLCVAEPTLKSLMIAKKLVKMGRELGIKHNFIVINKVIDTLRAAQLYSEVFTDERPRYYIVRYSDNIIKLENSGKGLNELPHNDHALQDVKQLINSLRNIFLR